MQALVGVDGDRAETGKTGGATRFQPLIHHILGKTFAHVQRRHLVQPGLDDVEQQQQSRDDGEDLELMNECIKIAPFQGIVKRRIPFIEPDLPIGGKQYHREQRDRQQYQPGAHRRCPEGAPHHPQLGGKIEIETRKISRALALIVGHGCCHSFHSETSVGKESGSRFCALRCQAITCCLTLSTIPAKSPRR
ncbi:hypothetical protein D3C86_1177390 [compost metagenome]